MSYTKKNEKGPVLCVKVSLMMGERERDKKQKQKQDNRK
jgi:hypothetical protein